MSTQVQRVFTTDFKERVVLRIDAGERLAAVADDLGITGITGTPYQLT